MIEKNIPVGKSTDSRDSVVNTSVTSTLQPNYNIARRYIECFGDENTKQTFQIIPDSKAAKEENINKTLHGSLKELKNTLIDWNKRGYCISFVPNKTNLKGRKKTDIIKYCGFFIDSDNGSPQDYHLEPSIVVKTSGNNSHSYWLFVKPVSYRNFSTERYEQLNKKLVEHYDADLQAKDVNKALRMPGFIYQKYDKKTDVQSEPSLVTFENNNVRYGFNDLINSINDLEDNFENLLKEKTDWLLDEFAKDSTNGTGKLYQIAELLSKTAKKLKNEDYLEVIKRELISLGELINLDKNKCKCIIEDAINSGYFRNKGFNTKPANNNKQQYFNKLDDVELARNILESGAIDYLVDDWEEWSKVGMCLHSTSDELLPDWDNWSRQSEKYKHDCCDKAWNNFKDNGGLGIGSLIHWAEKGGWTNPNKSRSRKKASTKKQQRTKEAIENYDEYFVENTTIENSILKVIFKEGKGNWSTINGNYYKYLEDKGYWNKQSEDYILKLISSEIRKFYSIDRRTGEYNYKFFDDAKINSAYRCCRKNLALTEQVNNEHLISFTNGTYNIESRQLEPHKKQNNLTWGIDAEYRENNTCPKVFQDFIISSFGAEYIELIRAIISMYLDPKAPYGYFVHLIGKSGSGKGTLIKLLQSSFHENCTTSINHFSELQSAEKRHQLLSGIRFCVAPDVNQFQGSISAFYELVDNGFYSGRPLYSSEAYNKQWNCRFLLASTQLLGIENAAEGWNRRCISLQLKERSANPDLKLANKLKDAKAEIISWALGINDQQRDELLVNAHNFEPIKNIKLQQETFADSVKAFFDSCTNYDIDAPLLTDNEIYKRYKLWCKASNYQSIKITSFKNKLNEMFGMFKTGGKVYKDRETKRAVREPVRWKCIRFIPYLFTSPSEFSNDLNINESRLQEGNLQDYFDEVTKLRQYETGYTNSNFIDVTAESVKEQEIQDSVTKLHQYTSKVVNNEKTTSLDDLDSNEKSIIDKSRVSPAIDVTFVTDSSNVETATGTEVTPINVTNESIDVTEAKKCNHVTEANLNSKDLFSTTCDTWNDNNFNSYDDRTTDFKVGDTVVYSGHVPYLKKKFEGILTIYIIGKGQIKVSKLDGTEIKSWINASEFRIVSPLKQTQ